MGLMWRIERAAQTSIAPSRRFFFTVQLFCFLGHAMPSLSAEQKAALTLSSRGAAAAFLEDMQYIREVVARLETSRGELRRISSVLRRLLIDGDLSFIATPRIGRIKVSAPDNKPYYNLDGQAQVLFFGSGGAKIFGSVLTTITMLNAGKPKPGQKAEDHASEAMRMLRLNVSPASPQMRVDTFLTQRVLCYFGDWVSRQAAIKYMAHVASGVHSSAPETQEEALIERIRAACSYGIHDGHVEIHVLPKLGSDSANVKFAPGKDGPTLNFEIAALDPVLGSVPTTTIEFNASV